MRSRDSRRRSKSSKSKSKKKNQVAQEKTKIEDYAFLSDTQTGALVSRDGCVDWLCFPRFDSPACFASLVGDRENGHWRFFPKEKVEATRRRYRGETLILETEIETKSGAVRLIDFMPPRGENPDIIRIIEGLRGKVSMQMELIIRFDYGQIIPWVRRRKQHDGLEAIAGPDALILRTPVETCGKDLTTVAEFTVAKGDRIPFVLTWFASHTDPPRKINPEHALRDTEIFWADWAKQFQTEGKWRDAIVRSLMTLKGFTYAPTGGLVAAPTTSLPEQIGGVRNWDYRYCWWQDAALMVALVKFLESHWQEPDEGIWEVRGPRQHFTHSKMMAWLAFDRAIKLIEDCDCAAGEHFDRWQKIRDQIHGEVCDRGYNPKKKAFTQFYGSDALDASLLTMPLAGFLPVSDERVRGTIEAIERELMQDGLVLRYRPQQTGVDGLPGTEGVFLPCSFWLADCWHLMGRKKEARELFERLLDLRNDLGLLSEEYDPRQKRQLGNFPQAFSHVALVSCARILGDEDILFAGGN